DAHLLHAVVARFGAHGNLQRSALVEVILVAATGSPAPVELVDLEVIGGVGKHVSVVVLGISRGGPANGRKLRRAYPAQRLAEGRGIQRAEHIGAGTGANGSLGALLG